MKIAAAALASQSGQQINSGSGTQLINWHQQGILSIRIAHALFEVVQPKVVLH